jgi:hypothetical protein
MRNLNAKQKKILTEQFESYCIRTVEDLDEQEYDEVYNVNPHENFDSNADRFLYDLYIERKYPNAN